MGTKLFVGGLAWATSDESLRTAFEAYGKVTDAKVITDRETGRSRGFGFVTFADEDACREAMEKMDGSAIDGRNVRVNEAQERRPGGGGGRPGGGYGGGRPGGGGGGYGGGGGDRRPPPSRGGGGNYPPVERRSFGGPPAGGPGGAPDPFAESKPAGRKRHNGGRGKKQRGTEGTPKTDYNERRRGGGNRRQYDEGSDW